ncbi:Ig-like domain-containing protein [Leadbettera azotonutricia]|uniref:Putative lipoprotein n=1 Tax=Leadbettera azotonutricia (strain ATCC BAA-888 / DSM 13862 / ZAS-9) TaxID=545695 RepID=F5YDQ1_LEAAZ|nr:Ig-like domain-containing protein [Leadbettera azotonutricia]AEF80838.1 putative lipoprotein [Leadbettera azotonutricia ZAS-9]
MRKFNIAALFSLFLTGILLLASCNNIFSPSEQENKIEPGKGSVKIAFGQGEARQIVPEALFDFYDFTFTKDGVSLPVVEKASGESLDFELETGSWRLDVNTYRGDRGHLAATGYADFAVAESSSNTVKVLLSGVVSEGKGTFSYSIQYPQAAELIYFNLGSLELGGGTPVIAGETATLSGSNEVDAGYYILSLKLAKNGKEASFSDVVEIYKNNTSKFNDKVFTDAHFTGTVAVTDILLTAGGDAIGTEALVLNYGDTKTLAAVVAPSYANSAVDWVSNDTSIVTVAGGILTAQAKSGSTTVTATAGAVTKTINVTVSPLDLPITGITLKNGNDIIGEALDLTYGTPVTLTAEVIPVNNSDSEADNAISWATNRPDIVTVNNGVLTAQKTSGKATITATAKEGTIAKSVVITVQAPVTGTAGIPVTSWEGFTIDVTAPEQALFFNSYGTGAGLKNNVLKLSPPTDNSGYLWGPVKLDLSQYAGQSIKITISVDAHAEASNAKVHWKVTETGDKYTTIVNTTAAASATAPAAATGWTTVRNTTAVTVTPKADSPWLYLEKSDSSSDNGLGNRVLYLSNMSVTITPATPDGDANGVALVGNGRYWNDVKIIDVEDVKAVHFDSWNGRYDVLKLTSPTPNDPAWGPLQYSLKEYRGQNITVTMSVYAWIDTATRVWWQSNGTDYPIIVSGTDSYGYNQLTTTKQWVRLSTTTSGRATNLLEQNNPVIYLSQSADYGLNGVPVYLADFQVSVISEGSYTELSGISIAGDKTRNLLPGDEITLAAALNPAGATRNTITWTSSNELIATVANGVVTAVGNGTATITASSDKTKTGVAFTDEVTVIVGTPVSVETVTLSVQDPLTINRNTTQQLTAAVLPAGANQAVNWTSSNPSVATVSNGVVTALAKGTTEIRATSAVDAAKFAAVTVTVQAPVTGITPSGESSLTLNRGQETTLSAAVVPSDANNQTINWSSSNSGIVSVANGVIKAEAAGSATITASTAQGGFSRTVIVTVKIPVESVAIQGAGSISILVGGYQTLQAAVNPSEATEGTVSWISSDNTVANVDSTGKVTGIKGGTAYITARAGDKVSNPVTVTVSYPEGSQSISFNWAGSGSQLVLDVPNAIAIQSGESVTLNGPNTGYETYQWTEGSRDIPGATNASFTFNSAGRDKGTYRIALFVTKPSYIGNATVSITIE